jgi:putative SOS response-associated peptidase YedK
MSNGIYAQYWIMYVESCILSTMCGRFIQISDPKKIRASLFDIEMNAAEIHGFSVRYNIAPTQSILTVLNTKVPRLAYTRWGLIPFWAKDGAIGNKMINARAETLLSKPSFKTSLRKRRCIIFSDGFYEWKGAGKGREPFFIRLKSRAPFGFAGLWDTWTDKQTGQDILSSTIITTDAIGALAEVHNRMPVILDPDHYKIWLSDQDVPEPTLMHCLKPYSAQEFEMYRISSLVNNPGNDSAECMWPI